MSDRNSSFISDEVFLRGVERVRQAYAGTGFRVAIGLNPIVYVPVIPRKSAKVMNLKVRALPKCP